MRMWLCLTIFCMWPRPRPAERWRVVALTILHLCMWPVVMWWRKRLLFWWWVIPPVSSFLRKHITRYLKKDHGDGYSETLNQDICNHCRWIYVLDTIYSMQQTQSADLVVQRCIGSDIAMGIYMWWCLLHTAHLHSCKCAKREMHL